MIVLGNNQELAFPNTELIAAVKLVKDAPTANYANPLNPSYAGGHIEIYFSGAPNLFHVDCSSYEAAKKSYEKILDIIKEDRQELIAQPAGIPDGMVNDTKVYAGSDGQEIIAKLEKDLSACESYKDGIYRRNITRIKNKAGVRTIRDLIKLGRDGLAKKKFISKWSIRIADKILETNGLYWGFPEDNYKI